MQTLHDKIAELICPLGATSRPHSGNLIEISKAVASLEIHDDLFSQLAIEIFQLQFEKCAPYRNFCQLMAGVQQSSKITDWAEIPALPTTAFKYTDHPISIHPPQIIAEESTLCFKSSGTTSSQRSHHYLPASQLYEMSILAAWRALNLPSPTRFLMLGQNHATAPDSSLAFMLSTLGKRLAPADFLIDSDGRIDLALLRQGIDSATGNPVVIFGTALAFLNLFEQLDEPLSLPAGSQAVETGGYKGSGRDIEKPALYQLFKENLSIEAFNIWNEYSMTELSSQAYARGLESPHFTPPWMRVKVISPENRRAVQAGEIGLLVIYDLANFHSCLAIETQDLVRYHSPHSFTFIGRTLGSPERGCSRAADFLLNQP